MSISIRLWILIVAAISFSFPIPTLAQSWPSRPVKIVSPFAAGGSSDLIARLVAQRLQEAFGSPVIVENRTGAGGIIATEVVAKAAPNGYTLLLASPGSHITAPLLQKTPYDPLQDFAPISNVNSNPHVLVVHPSVAATNVYELIALAKAQPGKLNVSTGGPGSMTEMSAIVFNHLARVQTTLVPYRGGVLAIGAVLAGEAQVHFTNPFDAISLIKAGKLRALGVTSAKSFVLMPAVPTIAESGLPGFAVETWYGLVAPAGTPTEIVNRISGVIQELAREATFRQRMTNAGTVAIGDTPEQFQAFLQAQVSLWSTFFRESGIKIIGQKLPAQ